MTAHSYTMVLGRFHTVLGAVLAPRSPWKCVWCGQRHVSSNHPARAMKAWQVTGYDGMDNLTLSTSVPVPSIRQPDDILVRIHAASLNHVDIKMLGGYAASMLNTLRAVQGLTAGSEFPLIPGRDFSGVVVRTGRGTAASRFKPGDEVWGAVLPVRSQGSLAEYVMAPAVGVTQKPDILSHVEAASIPFVALAAWAALCTQARLSALNAQGKRVLILGSSGGVGTFAIQLLRSWGVEVTVTCPEDAFPLVTDLGADVALDYKSSDMERTLSQLTGFDVILDCTGDHPDRYSHLLEQGWCSSYVTLNTPIIRNTDQLGLFLGATKSIMSLVPRILQGQVPGKNYHWAVVQHSQEALRTAAQLVSAQKVRAVVDEKFDFADVPAALSKLMQGPNRGKTVIDMSTLIEETS